MSNDPATLLRESERVEIPAVLEIGHAGNAAALPLMLTDPVVIPVQLEWTGGELRFVFHSGASSRLLSEGSPR